MVIVVRAIVVMVIVVRAIVVMVIVVRAIVVMVTAVRVIIVMVIVVRVIVVMVIVVRVIVVLHAFARYHHGYLSLRLPGQCPAVAVGHPGVQAAGSYHHPRVREEGNPVAVTTPLVWDSKQVM